MNHTRLSREQIKNLRKQYLKAKRPMPATLEAAWKASERRRLDELSAEYAAIRKKKQAAAPKSSTVRKEILFRKPVPYAPKVALPIDPWDARIREFYASAEWRYLRYDTIKHYGARCQCCNRTPEEHGIVIHVDHIVPLRKDWSRRLDRTNTQPLCEECNQGKGSRHSDDWRRQDISFP